MSFGQDWDHYLLELLGDPSNHPYLLLLPFVFVVGACVGSLLNVCMLRMPLGRSMWWPSSHCWQCMQPVRGRDNIPVLSYLLLRGRCRTCGARYSARYCLIEFLTATAFALLWWSEVALNVRRVGLLGSGYPVYVSLTDLALTWAYHAVLLSCLIVGTSTALSHRMVPGGMVRFAAVVGIVGGTLGPWPWPVPLQRLDLSSPPATEARFAAAVGLQPRPFGLVQVRGFRPGEMGLGLLTGLAGTAVGYGLVRIVQRAVRMSLSRDVLTAGEAGLLLMIGAFVGWQVVLIVFVGACLAYAPVAFLTRSGRRPPLAPFLAGVALASLLGVGWLSPLVARWVPGIW